MSYKYHFTTRVLKQQDEIITWYAERSLQAAEVFVDELYKIIDSICEDPYLYRNPYKDFREVYWKKYRYHIIFFVNEESKEVIIFNLYHSSRDPKNKYE
ncbi:MAG TPA: type II toxin-antitoxin system RelE/ParE family toxin [Sphingobacterium sp.]|nr:type II toxin-antitoxin system RelE/ParE family toxin [Sphingobacterium sp.]